MRLLVFVQLAELLDCVSYSGQVVSDVNVDVTMPTTVIFSYFDDFPILGRTEGL